MSAVSFMEWNAKPPVQWEWDNLVMFSSKAAETSRTLRPNDWAIEAEELVDSEPLLLYENGGGSSSCTSIDLGYASVSKSSKSASINSSSTEDMKMAKSSVETHEGFPVNNSKKDVVVQEQARMSSPLESSVCSGEPLFSLKLGKRIYFQHTYEGNNLKASDLPLVIKSSDGPAKKNKSDRQGTSVPRCQVEGCNLDLSSAKDYHRKHRVCENHSKCPKVIVRGVERRFCQQCSRFHGLSEFDEKKRSCRKRLSDHNARRRKPQPDVSQLNPARLSGFLFGGLQQPNAVFSRVPVVHNRSADNLSWASTPGPKVIGNGSKPGTAGGIGEHLAMPRNGIHNAVKSFTVPSKDPQMLSFKGDSSVSSTLNAPQSIQRALSLLSTDSRDSCRPKSTSPEHPHHTNHIKMSTDQPLMHAFCQSSKLESSDFWHAEQQPNQLQEHTLNHHIEVHDNFGGNNLNESLFPEARRNFSFDFVRLN